MVGGEEGLSDGEEEEGVILVGPTVGVTEGISVGDEDKELVGALLWFNDGLMDMDGVIEGLLDVVGISEGRLDGEELGSTVGINDGLTVG